MIPQVFCSSTLLSETTVLLEQREYVFIFQQQRQPIGSPIQIAKKRFQNSEISTLYFHSYLYHVYCRYSTVSSIAYCIAQ
jgi:hypothetical protein